MKKDHAGLKNELYYLWAFYKWFVIAGLLLLILAVYFLTAKLTEKETVLSVMLIDCCTNMDEQEMAENFEEAAGIDRSHKTVSLQNTLMFNDSSSGSYVMSCLSKFMSDIGNEKLDVCGMLETDFVKYDDSGSWMDLSDCLDNELMESLSDAFLQTDDGRIIGIYADALPGMVDCGCYVSGDSRGVIGIAYNSRHVELAVEYLNYLVSFDR